MSLDKRKIFVGNVSYDTTTEQFRTFVSEHGAVDDAVVMTERGTGKPRGFAFVVFNRPEDAESFMTKSLSLNARDLHAEWASPKTNTITETSKLYVRGLDAGTSEEEFQRFFEEFGPVNNVYLARGRAEPKGFGFVTFDSVETARRVLEEPFLKIDGQNVIVEFAMPRRDERAAAGGPDPEQDWSRQYDSRVEARESIRDRERPMKIFIAGLGSDTTKAELDDHFSQFGRITDSIIMVDRDGNPRGFGFVTYESRESARSAVNAKSHPVAGREVEVKHAVPPKDSGRGRVGAGGGRDRPRIEYDRRDDFGRRGDDFRRRGDDYGRRGGYDRGFEDRGGPLPRREEFRDYRDERALPSLRGGYDDRRPDYRDRGLPRREEPRRSWAEPSDYGRSALSPPRRESYADYPPQSSAPPLQAFAEPSGYRGQDAVSQGGAYGSRGATSDPYSAGPDPYLAGPSQEYGRLPPPAAAAAPYPSADYGGARSSSGYTTTDYAPSKPYATDPQYAAAPGGADPSYSYGAAARTYASDGRGDSRYRPY